MGLEVHSFLWLNQSKIGEGTNSCSQGIVNAFNFCPTIQKRKGQQKGLK